MIGSGGASDTIPVSNLEKASSKIYVVKQNDDLWTIAKKEYGSGYNWVDIASANKIANADVISEGTSLIIPNVKQKELDSEPVEQNSNSITGNSYTVVSGDFLWDIAVRAYGDGYRWVEIAKVNNLTNPDLIFSGDVLKIPR